jgi:hypothetical protein
LQSGSVVEMFQSVAEVFQNVAVVLQSVPEVAVFQKLFSSVGKCW